MNGDFRAVLDACVLLPMPLADTLLRMAETPQLFLPRWTDEILNEVSRNLVRTFNKTEEQARRRETNLRLAFPEAWVDESYRALIPVMTNHQKDRHVLAAAVLSRSEVIVTYDKKDFQPAHLSSWGIQAVGPSRFLLGLYGLNPSIVTRKLVQQAEDINISFDELLSKLHELVPKFVEVLSAGQENL